MDDAPLWLFGDQLGPHVHGTDEHRHREVVLVESSRVLRTLTVILFETTPERLTAAAFNT